MTELGPAALVSGAGTGIGRATTLALAEAGYRVALSGRRRGPLEDVAAEVTARDGQALVVPADVSTETGAVDAVGQAVAQFGRLDTLVCNHGIGTSAKVGDDTLAGWETTLRINLTGPFLLARAALPHLLESRGSIINVGSTNGRYAGPGWASYNASKAGLAMLTRSLAVDYGAQGVRANCVCPGWVRTPMGDDDMAEVASAWGGSVEDGYWLCNQETPLGRPAEAEEVAAVIVFLAGPQASYLTGLVIPVDGGSGAVDASATPFNGPPERLRELLG